MRTTLTTNVGDCNPSGLCTTAHVLVHRLTCFVMMTGGWVDVLGPLADVNGGAAAAYVVGVVLVGNFIILNLFIAVLLNAFQEEEEEPEDTPEDHADNEMAGAAEGGGKHNVEDGQQQGTRSGKEDVIHERPWPHDHTLYCFGPRSSVRRACQQLVVNAQFDQVIVIAIVVSSICLAHDVPRLDPSSGLAHTLHTLDYFWTLLFFGEMTAKVCNTLRGSADFALPAAPLCGVMTSAPPANRRPVRIDLCHAVPCMIYSQTLDYLPPLCLQVIAYGFCTGEHAYTKDAWNVLDLLIVTISILVLLAEFFPPLAKLKVLRVLRVLRPLRLLARSEGMRLIIISLFQCAPAVSNVFGVILAFQVVFAILGMQIFMGRLGSCTDRAIPHKEDCHPPAVLGGIGEVVAGLYHSASDTSADLGDVPSVVDGRLLASTSSSVLTAVGSFAHSSVRPSRWRRRLKGGGSNGVSDRPVQWVSPPLGDFDSFRCSCTSLVM